MLAYIFIAVLFLYALLIYWPALTAPLPTPRIPQFTIRDLVVATTLIAAGFDCKHIQRPSLYWDNSRFSVPVTGMVLLWLP